jgi:transcriptional regulator with XRE-family HTH domain
MSKASQLIETSAFSERLRLALQGVGVRPSPTLVANEFNLRYWGESITINTARNWLLGKSIPTQDKLRVLADWLRVSLDELSYGTLTPTFRAQGAGFRHPHDGAQHARPRHAGALHDAVAG